MNETAPNGGQGRRLVGASEVAQIARVQPSAVSNWRKRYPGFPGAGSCERGQISSTSLRSKRGCGRTAASQGAPGEQLEQLWAVADRLRGKALAGDLPGAVAAGSALLYLARQAGDDVLVDQHRPAETGGRVQALAKRFAVERAELANLFTPLLALDPPSLGLLLDSLADFETDDGLLAALDYVLERSARYANPHRRTRGEAACRARRPALQR